MEAAWTLSASSQKEVPWGKQIKGLRGLSANWWAIAADS